MSLTGGKGSGGGEGGGGDGGGEGGGEGGAGTAAAAGAADPVRSRGGSPDPQAAQGGDETHDALYHVRIRSSNFSRTVDFVSLGERGLVEFVQLTALMEPQLIWYRPMLKSRRPWQ